MKRQLKSSRRSKPTNKKVRSKYNNLKYLRTLDDAELEDHLGGINEEIEYQEWLIEEINKEIAFMDKDIAKVIKVMKERK